MCGPGQRRRDHDVQQRFRRKRAEQQPQTRRILEQSDEIEQLMQRHQHQAEPDCYPPKIAGARDLAPAEHQHAEQDQRRRGRREIKREELNDQRRADIGPEHHGEGRHQVHQAAGGETRDHQPRGGAILQYSSDAEAR
jgi:hypothetical protein